MGEKQILCRAIPNCLRNAMKRNNSYILTGIRFAYMYQVQDKVGISGIVLCVF